MSDHHHDDDELPVRGSTELISVGIDIGSSTSHLMFSKLRIGYRSLHRRHPEVLDREILHRSSVLLTPFLPGRVIDSAPLSEWVEATFREAGLTPEEVDTGAVILTGEACRRTNARKIGELFSDSTGKFVCATAGPRLEAILAAHGSGTVGYSKDWGTDLLNVDVGGGTTKVTLVRSGRIAGVTVLNIGARLIAYDKAMNVNRIEQAGLRFLDKMGETLAIGDPFSEEIGCRLARTMAEALFSVLGGNVPPWEGLMVLEPFDGPPKVKGVVFSGGVSEYIYSREDTMFGDLGPYLGLELSRAARASGYEIMNSDEGLRATVIGASQYTVQMSGETIHLPVGSDLPLRNLRVVPVYLSWQSPITDRSREAILKALGSLDPEIRDDPFALAIHCPEFIGYSSVQKMAAGLSEALKILEHRTLPKALIFNCNIGRVVGGVLDPEMSIPCIDEVVLSELDFIDVGKPGPQEDYVPVVVKSLAFGV